MAELDNFALLNDLKSILDRIDQDQDMEMVRAEVIILRDHVQNYCDEQHRIYLERVQRYMTHVDEAIKTKDDWRNYNFTRILDCVDHSGSVDWVADPYHNQSKEQMKTFGILLLLLITQCSTTVAVLDVAGSTVVYAGKTVVNTVDALTPDIVNRK